MTINQKHVSSINLESEMLKRNCQHIRLLIACCLYLYICKSISANILRKPFIFVIKLWSNLRVACILFNSCLATFCRLCKYGFSD